MPTAQASSISAQLKAGVEKAAKALILEIDANLRKTTPVDTGHARASWVPSVSTPIVEVASGSSGTLHDQGVQAVIRYKLELGPMFESNNVPYLPMLNLGNSKHAPAGFIEAAVDQALATIQQKYNTKIIISTTGAGTFGDAAGGAAASNLASAYSPFGGDE